MDKVTRVGIDLAKRVFHVTAVDADGAVLERRKLRRAGLQSYLALLPAGCTVAMEACGGAHQWYPHSPRVMGSCCCRHPDRDGRRVPRAVALAGSVHRRSRSPSAGCSSHEVDEERLLKPAIVQIGLASRETAQRLQLEAATVLLDVARQGRLVPSILASRDPLQASLTNLLGALLRRDKHLTRRLTCPVAIQREFPLAGRIGAGVPTLLAHTLLHRSPLSGRTRRTSRLTIQ